MFRLCLALAVTIVSAAAAGAQTPRTHQHGFAGAEHWARVFDDPARDRWQKPDEVIAALALAPDDLVADIGAGTGYFAVRLALKVPQGRVFAVDIEPGMVKYVSERAHKTNLDNLTAVLAEPDDPKLPAKVDLALLVDTYHHIGNREAYFRRLAGALKAGGRLAIVDFTMQSAVGPPASGRVAPMVVKAEMQRAGYLLVAEHTFLPNQYFLVFRPQ
jgi:cyclopropane fatty-acyl-phospholipid synthase-like methyltransferase